MGLILGVRFIPPTMGQSGIILGARSVPPTTGQSVSEVSFEGFRLWSGSGPPAYFRTFTIFSWKLGIVAVSNSAFQSWNHSVGLSF